MFLLFFSFFTPKRNREDRNLIYHNLFSHRNLLILSNLFGACHLHQPQPQHLHIGGDSLYATAQWAMAKLDSRACRKLIADTIASYSHWLHGDGCCVLGSQPVENWGITRVCSSIFWTLAEFWSWGWKYFESEDLQKNMEITENAPRFARNHVLRHIFYLFLPSSETLASMVWVFEGE